MTLDQAAALSLMFDLPRLGLTARVRAADPDVLDRVGRIAAKGTRGSPRGAAGGHAPSALERSPISRIAARHSRLSARDLVSRRSRGARGAARGHRRIPRRDRRGAGNGHTSRRGPRRGRHHRGQRTGAGCRFRRPSRSAARRPHDRGAGVRLGPHLSARTRRVGPGDHRQRARPDGVPAGHAAQRVSLPAAEPADLRPLPGGRRDRGLRAVRVAHHGRLRARAGPRRDGGSRQRPQRTKSWRTCAHPRRRHDCRNGRRYHRRTGAGANGAGAVHASQQVTSAAVSATSGDAVLRAMDAGQAYDFDAIVAASGLDGARLLPRLLDLEMQGRVHRIGGGRFMRSV